MSFRTLKRTISVSKSVPMGLHNVEPVQENSWLSLHTPWNVMNLKIAKVGRIDLETRRRQRQTGEGRCQKSWCHGIKGGHIQNGDHTSILSGRQAWTRTSVKLERTWEFGVEVVKRREKRKEEKKGWGIWIITKLVSCLWSCRNDRLIWYLIVLLTLTSPRFVAIANTLDMFCWTLSREYHGLGLGWEEPRTEAAMSTRGRPWN